jgi:hypothetical protein
MDHQNRRELVVSTLVVHASKEGEENKRTLYSSPAIAVAKGGGLFKAGWQVHIADSMFDKSEDPIVIEASKEVLQIRL